MAANQVAAQIKDGAFDALITDEERASLRSWLIPLTQMTATMGLAVDLKAAEHESNP